MLATIYYISEYFYFLPHLFNSLLGDNDIRTEKKTRLQKKSVPRSTACEVNYLYRVYHFNGIHHIFHSGVPARYRQANKKSLMYIKTFFKELIHSNPEMKPAEALLKVKDNRFLGNKIKVTSN